MKKTSNNHKNGNNDTVLGEHELWLYGYVCKLSNKFLMSENNAIIDKPAWCELDTIS